MEGERILEFANGLYIGNPWFQKRRHTPDHTQLRWLLNPDILHSLSQEFQQCSQQCESYFNEECVKQHYTVVFDFSAHIPRAKKRKFWPHTRTWKLRDPATAIQFQSDRRLMQLQLPLFLVQMLIPQIALCQLDQSWKVFCWLLPPKFVVSTRATNGNQNPGSGMKWWTKLYERSVHGSKFTVPWKREAWRQRLMRQKLYWCQARGKTYLLAGKVCGRERGIRHSIPRWGCFPFCQQMDRRNQDIVGAKSGVYTMVQASLRSLTKTRWRHRLSTMLGCSMLNLSGQATSSLRSLQLLGVCQGRSYGGP